ncbi:hypothetical protein [Vibrio sp. A2-1]|uniref:hypothetical protein n=1 Tax=Vibrio sp. A2-1 TaxID=2912252 RepID=UPI001F336DEC|nr:hypothetical protein [Vibrio sp. A2-1]MCF7487101.1 hypothetical protein [Vibrio sp. A2-1]
MKYIVQFLFAYIGSKLIFGFFNFNYNFISDPFDLMSLVVDIGVFVVLWVLADFGFKVFARRKRETNS